MLNRWSDAAASECIAGYGREYGEDLALRTYSSRLIGVEKELVLHGGGNTSVKGSWLDIFGKPVPAVFIKASGHDLAHIDPGGFSALDMEYLTRLRNLAELSDERMTEELLTHRMAAHAPMPSIEALMHVFLPAKFIDHTHANAILALTNRPGGVRDVREALGADVIVMEYVEPGFRLARRAAEALEASPRSKAIILMKHGLVTWGDTARKSYDRTVDLVTEAEQYAVRHAHRPVSAARGSTSPASARERYRSLAPVLRGLLAVPSGNADRPHDRFILRPLMTQEVLDLIESERGREIVLSPPLTADHLIRTKTLPLWIDRDAAGDMQAFIGQAAAGIGKYAAEYTAYMERHASGTTAGLYRFDAVPRVIVMPGMGVICAGQDVEDADIVRDITAQTLAVKTTIAAMGAYEGLSEEQLFAMEYRALQHAKLPRKEHLPLRRSVALITGAAGAIGAGICQVLLDQGCHVAATDVEGDRLTAMVDGLKRRFGERVMGARLDVTDPESVAGGFGAVIEAWGGVDLLIVNAGMAHVSTLAEMDPAAFRRLERVNVEGTLHLLAGAARHFKAQGTGGDIVLISTKNVFAPGAKFGAYSATKAAAHQLARIASLELAELDVRVNMVAPDAVFSHGEQKSGLWAEVGPDRMRARGLDEGGLEEYYHQRNLLKAKITATHVARAVLFFATRQTPTTGATIPVDGGLPDATPR